ncbi:unnamed protein product, partial [Brenthis ino]
MGKGKTLRSDLRNVVLKVMTYFENEKKNRSYIIPVDQAMKRTAMATGISERTLRNIRQEVKKVASASSEAGASTSTEAIKLSTPRKKKKKSTLEIDDFMICAIGNIINSFYTRVAEKNVSQSEKEIEKLTRDAIISISADDCKREINHVDRLRQQYWESDRLQELNERELIISLGTNSESDTDSIFSDSESEISGVESMDTYPSLKMMKATMMMIDDVDYRSQDRNRQSDNSAETSSNSEGELSVPNSHAISNSSVTRVTSFQRRGDAIEVEEFLSFLARTKKVISWESVSSNGSCR